jgi:HEPN domain-containing protein
MNTEKVIAGYLRVASEDLQGAIALAKIPNRNAFYLCSQAAEKVIRAVLTSEGKHAGIGHQLDRMVDAIPDENTIKPLLRGVSGQSASRQQESNSVVCTCLSS